MVCWTVECIPLNQATIPLDLTDRTLKEIMFFSSDSDPNKRMVIIMIEHKCALDELTYEHDAITAWDDTSLRNTRNERCELDGPIIPSSIIHIARQPRAVLIHTACRRFIHDITRVMFVHRNTATLYIKQTETGKSYFDVAQFDDDWPHDLRAIGNLVFEVKDFRKDLITIITNKLAAAPMSKLHAIDLLLQ